MNGKARNSEILMKDERNINIVGKVVMKKKVAIVSNIPSPYRVDLFYYIQTQMTEYEWTIIYTNESESNRRWSVDKEKLGNTIILDSKVLEIKGKLDSRFVHIPPNIGSVLNSIKADAVIAFEYNPAALQCFFWCKTRKVPFVHLTDGTLNSEKSIGVTQKLSRKLIIPRADACIASSTKAKEKLLHYGADSSKCFISLLTVDSGLFDRRMRKPVPGRILYVGSTIKRKGLDLLIDSLRYMKSDYRLHVVGNGDNNQIEELKKLAVQNGVTDKIEWRGYKEGVALCEEYMQASLFVLPTREDCFGLVLLEALYAGVPIVSSKFADGAYDIVMQGVNGVLADPYDTQGFAEAMDTVLNREEFANNALTIDSSKFNFENVVFGIQEAIRCANCATSKER